MTKYGGRKYNYVKPLPDFGDECEYGKKGQTNFKEDDNMKRILSIILLLGLLLTLFGCAESNPDHTEPPQSVETTQATVPPETTAPPEESTASTETTEPTTSGDLYANIYGVKLSQEVLNATNFEYIAFPQIPYYRYYYAGNDHVVHIPGDVTLTLPEDWAGKVTIRWSQDSDSSPWSAYVDNTDVLRAWAAYREGVEDFAPDDSIWKKYCGCIYILEIIGIPKTFTHYVVDSLGYLGEDEDYSYYFLIPDFQEQFGGQAEVIRYRNELIDAIGEEAYWELVGDLIVTEDMARQMITINDPVE